MFVSAPGKLILFGEHAVVYDKLGIVTAVNLRATVKAEEAKETSVKDGDVFFKVDRTELSSIRDKVEKLIEEKNYEKMKELSTDKTFCLKNVLSRCLG
jgi:mevalonate kinase